MSSGDYISKSAFVDSIMENVVITTEEGLELRGEIVDLIKNQPTLDEKEIIRKPMERIIERLKKIINRTKEEEKQNNDVVDTAMRCSYEHSMKIVKEEGGIE